MGSNSISRRDDVLYERVPALLEVDPFLSAEGETQLALFLATIYERVAVRLGLMYAA